MQPTSTCRSRLVVLFVVVATAATAWLMFASLAAPPLKPKGTSLPLGGELELQQANQPGRGEAVVPNASAAAVMREEQIAATVAHVVVPLIVAATAAPDSEAPLAAAQPPEPGADGLNFGALLEVSKFEDWKCPQCPLIVAASSCLPRPVPNATWHDVELPSSVVAESIAAIDENPQFVKAFSVSSRDGPQLEVNVMGCLNSVPRPRIVMIGASYLRNLATALCEFLRERHVPLSPRKTKSVCHDRNLVDSFSQYFHFTMLPYFENITSGAFPLSSATHIVLNRGPWDGMFLNTDPRELEVSLLDVFRYVRRVAPSARIVFYPHHAAHPPSNSTNLYVRKICLHPARVLMIREASFGAISAANAEGLNVEVFDVYYATAADYAKQNVDAMGHHYTGIVVRALARDLLRMLCNPPQPVSASYCGAKYPLNYSHMWQCSCGTPQYMGRCQKELHMTFAVKAPRPVRQSIMSVASAKADIYKQMMAESNGNPDLRIMHKKFDALDEAFRKQSGGA